MSTRKVTVYLVAHKLFLSKSGENVGIFQVAQLFKCQFSNFQWSETMDISKIKEHLTVHTKGEDNVLGSPIGTVEHMDGFKYIKLTKSDSPDGLPHWIPLDWVEYVDEQAVYLNKTQDEIITELMVYHCKPGIQ